MTVFTIRRILLAGACAYALYIAWFTFGESALVGLPTQLPDLGDVFFDRYLTAALIFPCCLFATIPKRWSTIPLWACCLWLLFFPFCWGLIMSGKHWYPLGLFGNSRAVEMICILVLPVFVQAVSELRRAGERP